MQFNYRKTIRSLLLIVDIALLVAVFYFIYTKVYYLALPVPFFRRGNYVLYLVYAAIVTAFIALMKGQSIGTMRIPEIILSQFIAILLTNFVAYFQISLLSYKLVAPAGFFAMTALQAVAVSLWALAANRLYFIIYPPQKMLLIYDDVEKISIADKLNAIKERYNICCYANIDSGRAEIAALLNQYESVVLAVKDPYLQEWLIHLCHRKDKRLYFVPNATNVITNGAESIHSVDTPLLLSRSGRMTVEERVWKRLFDILGSLAGLVILSPVIVFTAAAIWLCDRRSVFYFQNRLTRDGKVFALIKFRSMKVDAEQNGACLATVGDSRITPVGRVIRKLRIDEIPQLFNVLFGDMSLVGPRPERPEMAAEYEKVLPEFGYRLNVKAGLTGYAQVYGNYNTSASDKLLMDLMYIENYSFLRDLNLLFQTLRVVLLPEKAEGVPIPQELTGSDKPIAGDQKS